MSRVKSKKKRGALNGRCGHRGSVFFSVGPKRFVLNPGAKSKHSTTRHFGLHHHAAEARKEGQAPGRLVLR